MRPLSCHANCSGSRVRSERPGGVVKCGPVWCAREYHPTDGGVQAGRGFSWETYHDALPGCVGSGLHQVPRIQDLPRQGDHRRLQKRRTAASGLKEKAVNAGCSFCESRPLSQCPLIGKVRLPPDRPVLAVCNQGAEKSVAFLERSPSIGTGHLNATAVRDNRESSCGAPSALGEMRAITIPEKVQKSLDFDGRRALTGFASARRAEVDSQAQGMTIRLLPKTFAVARAISFGCA